MNQEKLSKEQKDYLQTLEASPGWKPDVIRLIREDFLFGLTKEQVSGYACKNGDIRRMKLYSQCLRKGYSKDVVDVLMDGKQDVYRCQLAVEFYSRGISLGDIQRIMEETYNAKEMNELLQEIVKQKEAFVRKKQEIPDYVQELLTQIQTVLGQMGEQERVHEQLKKAVAVLEASKKEEAERERLQQQIHDRDMQINAQQDELNIGHKKLAQLRNEIEKLEKEREQMKRSLSELQTKLKEKEDVMKEAEQIRGKQESKVPIYYSVPVKDQGKVVGRVEVERTHRNHNTSKGLVTKLLGLILPSQDLVKKVIQAGLDEQQLAQIKNAMERKLTDIQMNQLINPELSPQKMQELIELADLINQNQ